MAILVSNLTSDGVRTCWLSVSDRQIGGFEGFWIARVPEILGTAPVMVLRYEDGSYRRANLYSLQIFAIVMKRYPF